MQCPSSQAFLQTRMIHERQNQSDTINKALWAACDTFRGTISADTYKDFILTMLFLKYISDVWQDHYDEYKNSMVMHQNSLKP